MLHCLDPLCPPICGERASVVGKGGARYRPGRPPEPETPRARCSPFVVMTVLLRILLLHKTSRYFSALCGHDQE